MDKIDLFLMHLERVLSVTEQFKPQMSGKDFDWWEEASAFCADERELRDQTQEVTNENSD